MPRVRQSEPPPDHPAVLNVEPGRRGQRPRARGPGGRDRRSPQAPRRHSVWPKSDQGAGMSELTPADELMAMSIDQFARTVVGEASLGDTRHQQARSAALMARLWQERRRKGYNSEHVRGDVDHPAGIPGHALLPGAVQRA